MHILVFHVKSHDGANLSYQHDTRVFYKRIVLFLKSFGLNSLVILRVYIAPRLFYYNNTMQTGFHANAIREKN
jgi:hypothetical protein